MGELFARHLLCRNFHDRPSAPSVGVGATRNQLPLLNQLAHECRVPVPESLLASGQTVAKDKTGVAMTIEVMAGHNSAGMFRPQR